MAPNRMRGPPRRTDKDKHFYWGGGLIVVCAIGIALAAFLFPRDPDLTADLCPADGPTGHITLLIDATDPFTFTQQRAIRQLALGMADATASSEGTLLTIYIFGETIQASAEPLFEKCSPGSGANKSEITHTRKLWQERFQHEFREPLERTLDSLQPKASAAKSPILQMLQIVGLNFERRNAHGRRQLILICGIL